jgi:hypothetical protein
MLCPTNRSGYGKRKWGEEEPESFEHSGDFLWYFGEMFFTV